MAKIYNYNFDQMCRIGNDQCDLSQKTLQNSEAANYLLENYRMDCPMSEAVDLATSQPNVNYTGSHQVGIEGCNIDESSELQFPNFTKHKDKITLEQRQFLTVPFLGRGKVNVDTETELFRSTYITDKKSDNALSEISHISYRHTPMIPMLEEEIANPANYVEDSAAEGWIRGGVPTRELTRDKEHSTN